MKSSLLIVLAVGFAGFGALEVAALNPDEAVMGAFARASDSAAEETEEEYTHSVAMTSSS